MRGLQVFLGLSLITCLAACTPEEPRSTLSDQQRLLELHEGNLRAHLDGSIDALLANQSDDFLLLNRGEISSPTRQQRREFLGPYLAATKFEFYRDKVEPIVRVSRDGSLGWVAAQVEARGSTTNSQGEQQNIEFVVAWIELYERRDGEWIAIGNASSFR